MKMTSAEAAKLIRKLTEEQNSVKSKEKRTCTFTASIDESIDDVRPAYDFAATQERLESLEAKIRKVKHAVNMFNITTEVPGFDMTVDQILVYIPQMSEQKRRLSEMAARIPKERSTSFGNEKPEYTYANYDVQTAEDELNRVSDLLASAQTALDVVNSSVTFEVEL